LLAGSVGTSLAQSNVNVSGHIDVGVYRDTSSNWRVGSIQRSNIAFSGSEDLGGGMSATFKLSHRFAPDTGAAEGTPGKPFWHGESTLGLKGNFGQLRVGRALDAMYSNDWAFDPWYYFDSVASPAWDLWHYNFPSDPVANGGSADYGRMNNGVYYDSPTFNGISVHISTSPQKREGDANRPFGVSLNYSKGSVAAMLAHEKNSAGNTDTFLGLKGSVAGVTLMGAYDVSKAGASTAKATTLGAQYGLGAFTLNAGWGKVVVDGVKAQQTIGLGALYPLSKRTTVYVDLAEKRFPARSAVVYGAGMSHSF
jgi:predicted porin